tara:strand:+ start:230 stop:2038 length:1809 start_codon:yes stop_codon:yes gene_type:complete
MAENYKIEDIYQGGYSSLNPEGGEVFTGYRATVNKLGVSTDPRTANILKEVSDKIAPGQKVMELSMITPETVEAIPKQHMKEVNRLAKLTGVDVTIHGPLIDASGVTQQGFDDQQRKIAETKIINFLERSHDINPNGNSPVTFHTANQLPGARYSKTKEGGEVTEFMSVVDQETGQITGVKRNEKILPMLNEKGEVYKKMYEVEKQLRIMNDSQWDESLQRLIIPKEHADKIIAETSPFITPLLKDIQDEKIDPNRLEPQQKEIFDQYYSRFQNAHEQLEDIQKHLSTQFEKAYKYGTDTDKEYLKKAVEKFQKSTKMEKGVSGYSKALQGFMEDLRVEEHPLVNKSFRAPQIFKSAEKYAIEKSQETFGNSAWASYKKFGNKAPILTIENPPAGFGLSRGQDLKDMVEGARKQFEKNAIENGMSKSVAEKQSEKLIGVTWDVGHINQLRQFGFEGKDIIKEAEKVAPLVKHVHLSDNFGMENTELPMGMGNVDIKKVMKKLGKKGEDARKIIEAAHWWQFQQTSPVGVTMEALGSPLYSMGMGPYWNQAAGFQQGYFGGYGMMLPQINYETFGGGFSTLPSELGGQRPGAQGNRMGGKGME